VLEPGLGICPTRGRSSDELLAAHERARLGARWTRSTAPAALDIPERACQRFGKVTADHEFFAAGDERVYMQWDCMRKSGDEAMRAVGEMICAWC